MQTRERNTKDGLLVAKFGITYLQGNNFPYFSLTGQLGIGWRASYGMLHNEISEFLPELRPLIKWHLVDQEGVPMHYIPNAEYWCDLLTGKLTLRPTDPDPKATFSNHILFGVLPEDSGKDLEALMRGDRAELREWLRSRLPGLKAAFREEMGRFGVRILTQNENGGWS